MNHWDPEQSEEQLDAVLQRSVPTPDPAWVDGLERRLLPAARSLRVWKVPQVRLGAALAAGFATLLVVLALAGVGPLSGDSSKVRADDNCNVVPTSRVERVPELVEGPSGDRVVYRRKLVKRYERVCR